jgi:adenine C2-methylase RlmN of 23S rRNA A2503 and tRNA A37
LRNLTAAEIVGQLLLAKDELGDYSHIPIIGSSHHDNTSSSSSSSSSSGGGGGGDMMITDVDDPQLQQQQQQQQQQRRPHNHARSVTNIVFMGQGEPLYNYRHVRQALSLMLDPAGLAYSKRSITVSTSGVAPAIERLGRDTGVNLAVSLHAVHNDLRSEIVPLNRTFPLEVLLPACRAYPSSRRITFEYVMLKGVNDSLSDARELRRLLSDISALVNLIPFNPWDGCEYECSSNNTIYRFAKEVGRSLPVTIRWPRGREIGAACGQLSLSTEMNTNLSSTLSSTLSSSSSSSSFSV